MFALFMGLCLVLAAGCGLLVSFDMMRDTDRPSRCVGLALVPCCLIMASFGLLVIAA